MQNGAQAKVAIVLARLKRVELLVLNVMSVKQISASHAKVHLINQYLANFYNAGSKM